MIDIGSKVVYQIYPKSFYDTNGDGLGDIRGITAKLDYLQALGVDYIWSTPFFVSPQNDNGYDVEDYRAIDPCYGTMADVEELIAEADKRGIGLMFDMVFNHTSTNHEWFQKALAGDKKYQDYYILKDGKPDGAPPTNWVSKFGGNAWQYEPAFGKYYLHLFDRTQADLNWENPEVRHELAEVLKFWMKKGVKGFRFDVVNLISKPEVYNDDHEGDGRRFYTDGHRVHEFLKELCRESGLSESDLMTVGEMSSTSIDNCIRYSNPAEHELSMTFSFHHLKVDYKDGQKWALQPCDFGKLKDLLHTWQVEMQKGGGWNALFWCNHDQPRVLSRFGDDKKYPRESATMLATMIHLMRGTPYIYQGEEIGMTNAYYERLEQYRDVESINYWHILEQEGKSQEEIVHIVQERSRDNSRTPMQWDASENAGFTTGTPWLSVIHNYPQINVQAAVADDNSIFAYYQKLIALRKELPIIQRGEYAPLLTDHPSAFAYTRSYDGRSLVVVCNFYGQETQIELDDVEGYQPLINNYEQRPMQQHMTLRPYEAAAWIR